MKKIFFSTVFALIFAIASSVMAAPPAPTEILSRAMSDGSIEIFWTLPSEDDQYLFYIYRRDEGSLVFEKIFPDPIYDLRFKDTSVVPGQSYIYSVTTAVEEFDPVSGDVVYDESELGVAQTSVTAMTPSDDFLEVFLERPETPEFSYRQGTVYLDWEKSQARDIAGYLVLRSESQTGEYRQLTQSLLRQSHFFDTSVKSDRSYYYRVVVVDGDGNKSEMSDPTAEVSLRSRANYFSFFQSEDEAMSDQDADYLLSWEEMKYGTDPRLRDTDGDGLIDSAEIAGGTDPLAATSVFPDENANQIKDSWERVWQQKIKESGLSADQVDLFQTDSDGDGIVDALEYFYRTQAFNQDSDQDNLSDGLEILEFQTDPLVQTTIEEFYSRLRLVRPKDSTRIFSATPTFRGTYWPGREIGFWARVGKRELELGSMQTSDSGQFLFRPEAPLSDGPLVVYATASGGVTSLEKKLTIDTRARVRGPKLLAMDRLSLDGRDESKRVYTTSSLPIVRGQTAAGSQVFATFQSRTFSSTLLADSESGDFTVRASQELEPGRHIVSLVAIYPDGVESPETRIVFEVVPWSTYLIYALVEGDFGILPWYLWLSALLIFVLFWSMLKLLLPR